jgi:hypothetical protein
MQNGDAKFGFSNLFSCNIFRKEVTACYRSSKGKAVTLQAQRVLAVQVPRLHDNGTGW